MTVRIGQAAAIVGLLSLLTLTACTASPPADEGTGPASEESAAPVVEAPETACPAGFIDAYATAIRAFGDDLQAVEVDADAFEPDFLAPFLDGGCAVHVTGTQQMSEGVTIPADSYYGFATDGGLADAISEALEANGYTEDPDFPGNFRSADQTRFAGVLPVGGEVHFNGSDAVEQFYPGGVAFFA